MSQFKTITIEDTEMIYSLLREKFPNREIEIEYNDNTKEYLLSVTNNPFKEDPNVPVDIKIKIVYGDSVTGDTPLLLKRNGLIHIETIQSIFDESKKVEYPGLKMFDTTIRLEKEYSLSEYQVWSDIGWVDIKKVIRHKTDKKIYDILTDNGFVKVTEDHSLITENGEYIKPSECNLETRLLSNYPVQFDSSTKPISKDEAYIYGFYYGDCYTEYNDYVHKFYDSDRNKKIIAEILNSDIHVIKSFLEGYLSGEDKDNEKIEDIGFIECKGQICASGLFFLMRKLGYNVSIETREDKDNIFRLTFTNESQIKVCNQIKKIKVIENNDYVYDIETSIGRFQAGIGNIIVKNTDSVFLSLKYNRDDYTKNRQDTFKLSIQ